MMSLKNGLNLRKCVPAGQKPSRKALLDDFGDDDDSNIEPARAGVQEITSLGGTESSEDGPAQRKQNVRKSTNVPAHLEPLQDSRQDLSSTHASQTKIQAAEGLDASIFDYDNFHDAKSTVIEAKKQAARQDAIERKPKYIKNLLDAAARRKQDLQVAKEKLLQKERKAEGDEFADKEKFVTGAYKKQQEETRRLEEEEKKRTEEEERRKRQTGGGMHTFYRGMMEEQEKQYQEAMEATTRLEQGDGPKFSRPSTSKTDAELAAELTAKGISVHLNDEGQVIDKRELLAAGLNVAPSRGNMNNGNGSDHLRTSAVRATHSITGRSHADKQAQRERQSRMLEEQLAAKAKRAREEEEEERLIIEKAAKSTKTEKDVKDAKARYLARKAAKEKDET